MFSPAAYHTRGFYFDAFSSISACYAYNCIEMGLGKKIALVGISWGHSFTPLGSEGWDTLKRFIFHALSLKAEKEILDYTIRKKKSVLTLLCHVKENIFMQDTISAAMRGLLEIWKSKTALAAVTMNS